MRTVSPARLPRVRSAAVVALVAAVLSSGLAPAPAGAQTAPEPEAGVSDVVVGLRQLTRAFAGAGGLAPLDGDLPLTDVSVRDVLALDTALGTQLDAAVAGRSPSLDELAATVSRAPALTMTPVPSPPGAPVGSRDWELAVALTGTSPVPLRYAADGLELGRGAATGLLRSSLTGTVRVRHVPSAVPLRRFVVVGTGGYQVRTTTGSTAAAAASALPVPAFDAVDGFVRVSLAGTYTAASTTTFDLRDSDGRGELSTEDLQFGTAEDLFVVRSAPAAGDVTARLSTTTDLLAGAGGSIDVAGAPAAGSPYAAPVVTRSADLRRLTALTRAQALGALSTFTSALSAAEQSADADLPLLQGSVTDLFSPATQLLDLVQEQATARIVCGAANTSPPTGAPRPGQARYCSAQTDGLTVDDAAPVWTAADGAVVSGATAGTVGRAPTANVVVTGGRGFPRLRVTFLSDKKPRAARSLVTSVQELADVLTEVGLTGRPAYDPGNAALTLPLTTGGAAAAARQLRVEGAGELTGLTGLAGLCQAASAASPRSCPREGDQPDGTVLAAPAGAATVTTTDRRFAGTLGIGLPLPGAQQQQSAGAVVFLRPAADGVLWSVGDVTAALPATVPLSARIGFLQTDVDLSGYTLARNDATAPAAAARLRTGTVTLPGGTVADAVLAADVLSGAAPSPLTGVRNLRSTARLDVRDGAGPGGVRPLEAAGTVDASWPTLGAGAPTVVTSPTYAALRLLDLVPEQRGTAAADSGRGTGPAGTTELTDPVARFATAFGVTAGAATTVTRRVRDLDAVLARTGPTAGTRTGTCSALLVLSETRVRCTDPAFSGFVAGHRYVVDGDPTALRDVLLDDLTSVLSSFGAPGRGTALEKQYAQTLPLVDARPDQLAEASTALGKAVARLLELADDDSAAPVAGADVSTLQGFSAALVATQPSATATLRLTTADGPRLRVTFGNAAAGDTSVPLRVSQGESALRIATGGSPEQPTYAALPLDVRSSALVDLEVDLRTGRSTVGPDSSVVQRVTGLAGTAAAVGGALGDRAADLGGAVVRTAASTPRVDLAVAVRTAPRAGTGWVALDELGSRLEQVRTREGSRTLACSTDAAVAGCASIPLVPEVGPATTLLVALRADQSSGGSGAALQRQPLTGRFLVDALAALPRTLAQGLDGGLVDRSLPLVGTDLDGGADVPGAVGTFAVAARRALAGVDSSDAATATVLISDVRSRLGAVVSGTTKVVVQDATALCNGACRSDATVADVEDLRVRLLLTGTTAGTSPFSTGLAGMAVDTDRTVPTSTSWSLPVTVGLRRGSGPYVHLVPAAGATSVDVLTVRTTATLPSFDAAANNGAGSCRPWTRSAAWRTKVGPTALQVPAKGAGARCLDALVGKFPATLVDLPASAGGTALEATAVVSLTPGDLAREGRVSLPALFDRAVPFATALTGTGRIAVYAESFAASVGFFDVLARLTVDWDSTREQPWSDPAYDDAFLDAQTVYSILDVGYDRVRRGLEWLNPVADSLARPIPVISQIANFVGADDVTALSVLARQGSAVRVIETLLELQQRIARLPRAEAGVELVSLGAGNGGSFTLDDRSVTRTSCAETFKVKGGGPTYTNTSSGTASAGSCDAGNLSSLKAKIDGEAPGPQAPDRKQAVKTEMKKSVYFDMPAISFPVFEDSGQVYDLLAGKGDVTLLHVDVGSGTAEVEFSRTIGPFMIGPVPLAAVIGASVGLEARFAFGFDTRALSRRIEEQDLGDVDAIASGGTSRGAVFADGFYVDDLDGDGDDVPEIRFTLTVFAGAAISIGFAEAGVRGALTLDLSLDAHDPDGNGKIRVEEFAGRGITTCAFNVSSGLEFVLSAFISIDLFFFDIDESWDIVRSPRVKLFSFDCKAETPRLAVYDAATKRLTLTAGQGSSRGGFSTVTKESYTVRPLGPASGGTQLLQVSAFGLTQEFPVAADATVHASAGSDDDTLRFYPGQLITHPTPDTTVVTSEPFAQGVVLDLGDGDDTAVTGGAADVVTGGAGNDTIETHEGDDRVDAGAGDDTVDTGAGDDTLAGGDGADVLQGGPGSDVARGGAGGDLLLGGPGADPDSLFASDRPDVVRPLLDSGDVLVGEGGADRVDGGEGPDLVVGGDLAATPDRTATHRVAVTGTGALGSQDFTVDLSTVVLPTRAAALVECAASATGTATGGDVVSGGADDDQVLGGPGPDDLSGGAGQDLVCGRDGDDALAGDGADVPPADHAADVVLGGPGRDRLTGDGGDDDLRGDDGDDLLRGGDGADALTGGAGSDLLLGLGGADVLVGDGGGTAAAATGPARAIVCTTTASVVDGLVDLTGDLVGNAADDGQLEGREVRDGRVVVPTGATVPATTTTPATPAVAGFTGLLGDVSVLAGVLDVDGSGTAGAGDTGAVRLAALTGAVGNGDCLLGGDGDDRSLAGGAGGDYLDGGAGDEASLHGDAGDDLVRGGPGTDVVDGDEGDDLVAGDAGSDLVRGGPGKDVVRGGEGDDRLVGGSSVADAVDGPDELLGGRGADVLAGDNASLVAASGGAVPTAGVTLLTTRAEVRGTGDQLFGGFGDDWAFGQTGDDLVRGGHDDDVVEGGPGRDRVQGDDGNDLAVGGSSTDGEVTAQRDGSSVPDAEDEVFGDGGVDGLDGSDVVVGDNAVLDPRAATARTRWSRVRPEVGLTVVDVPVGGTGVGAADVLTGGGGDDLLLGLTGDDRIDAGPGADAVEGGPGSDDVVGGSGDDHLVGGSWTAGSADSAPAGAGDVLDGSDGDDVLTGDNARVEGAGGLARVTLLDHAPPVLGTSGDDRLTGGEGSDRLYGQSGLDVLDGSAGDDVLEGGSDGDRLSGGAGDDALVGGGSTAGTVSGTSSGAGLADGRDGLDGGPGDDVLAGDNARLTPVRDASGAVRRRADGTALRAVTLFDVQRAGAVAVAGVHGDDVLVAGPGRDLLLGQGGDDVASGGDGDDVLEGGPGRDLLAGDGGEDDLLGGSSATDGVLVTDRTDRLLTAPGGTVDTSAAGVADDGDRLFGGSPPLAAGQVAPPEWGTSADGADVLLGDNGRVTRPGGTLTYEGGRTRAVRAVAMADATSGGTAGFDELHGGAGDDDLYGQLGGGAPVAAATATAGTFAPPPGDVLYGGAGDDALVGDQGVDVPTPAERLGRPTTLVTKGGFLSEDVLRADTLVRVVTLTQPAVGDPDVLLGGDGADALHSGAGDDLLEAGAGDDVVFAGDGDDRAWGSTGHDRLFGGAGRDYLDVKPRTEDGPLAAAVAPEEDRDGVRLTVNDSDLVYGGDGPDALQADVGETARTPGDRLLDWYGAFNVFYVCEGAYGPGKRQVKPDPSTLDVLRELARVGGSTGPGELALVESPGGNQSPAYPGGPGNFTCETG